MPSGKEYLVDSAGFAGINNKEREQDLVAPTIEQKEISLLEARDIVNFDLTNKNSLVSREGYSKLTSLVNAHSGFAFDPYIICVCAQGLVSVHSESGDVSVLSAVNSNLLVSYARFGSSLYWANGDENGRITKNGSSLSALPWGIDVPQKPIMAVSATGGLRAGLYQVALTYLDGYVESGACAVQQIEVPAGGGIYLTNIPQNATKTRIYVSSANGEALYKYEDTISYSTTIEARTLGKKLETQHLDKPPVGHIIRYYKGRLLIAKYNWIFYTAPQRPHLYHAGVDVLPPFKERIRMIQPVEDGFFVDAGELYFVKFSKGDETALVNLLPQQFGVIEGTDVSVPGHVFQESGDGFLGYWWTQRGFPVVGKKGGILVPVGKDKIAVEPYGSGTSVLVEKRGITQLLSSFGGTARNSGLGVSDTLTATIVSRGI